MLPIVNSMPKCGSTYFHNFVVQCLNALGHPDAHAALEGQIAPLNERANPGALTGRTLAVLLDAARSSTFAVKAHCAAVPDLCEALRQGRGRQIYLVRHPAEIARSALAFGAMGRRDGRHPAYQALRSPHDAVEFLRPYMDQARSWLAEPDIAHIASYEAVYGPPGGPARSRCGAASATRQGGRERAAKNGLRPAQPAAKDASARQHVGKAPLDSTAESICDEWAEELGYDL